MGKIKTSYGIICCRQHVKYGFQVILIKKPVTYHFCEFLAGHYRKNDEQHLRKLFNNMTYHEKVDILSLRFSNMWYRLYKANPEQTFVQSSNYSTKQYYRLKTKFEVSFSHDGGQRLRHLMTDSINAETLWEIPKGRKKDVPHEDDLDAAIREFTEETSIDKDKYKILWHIKPYVEAYSDFGVTYKNVFYYADSIGNWEPTIKFSNNQQISEVSAIRWCSKNDLMHMVLEKTTYQRLLNMFDKVSKKYKNSKKEKIKLNRGSMSSDN